MGRFNTGPSGTPGDITVVVNPGGGGGGDDVISPARGYAFPDSVEPLSDPNNWVVAANTSYDPLTGDVVFELAEQASNVIFSAPAHSPACFAYDLSNLEGFDPNEHILLVRLTNVVLPQVSRVGIGVVLSEVPQGGNTNSGVIGVCTYTPNGADGRGFEGSFNSAGSGTPAVPPGLITEALLSFMFLPGGKMHMNTAYKSTADFTQYRGARRDVTVDLNGPLYLRFSAMQVLSGAIAAGSTISCTIEVGFAAKPDAQDVTITPPNVVYALGAHMYRTSDPLGVGAFQSLDIDDGLSSANAQYWTNWRTPTVTVDWTGPATDLVIRLRDARDNSNFVDVDFSVAEQANPKAASGPLGDIPLEVLINPDSQSNTGLVVVNVRPGEPDA